MDVDTERRYLAGALSAGKKSALHSNNEREDKPDINLISCKFVFLSQTSIYCLNNVLNRMIFTMETTEQGLLCSFNYAFSEQFYMLMQSGITKMSCLLSVSFHLWISISKKETILPSLAFPLQQFWYPFRQTSFIWVYENWKKRNDFSRYCSLKRKAETGSMRGRVSAHWPSSNDKSNAISKPHW